MIFVISAPSGAGKTTLCKQLLGRIKRLKYSISHTTRPQRRDEKEGIDYFFISEEEFKAMIDKGEFLEYTKVGSFYYGTSKKIFYPLYEKKYDILMELDVYGGIKLKELYPKEVVLIFILPHSLNILKERLIKRNTEDIEEIEKRLKLAKDELRYLPFYDHIISNISVEEATTELITIINSYTVASGEKGGKIKRIDL